MNTYKFSKSLLRLVGLAFLSTLALPSHAALVAVASVSDGTVSSQVTDPGRIIGNAAIASASTTADTHASASAAYGVVKVRSNGSTTYGGSNSGTQALFTDTLKLEMSSLAGKHGQITFAYYFDYEAWVRSTGNGFANGSVSLLARGGRSYSWFLEYFNTSSGGYTMYEYQDLDGQGRIYGVPKTNYIYVTTDFVWGEPIGTGFELQTSVGSYVPDTGGGAASYNFDASNSGYWAGIVSATADGQTITDYLLTSASGTDYSKSFVPANEVPEPSTFAMMFLGASLLGMQRKLKPYTKQRRRMKGSRTS